MAATDMEGLMHKLDSTIEVHDQIGGEEHLQDLHKYLTGNRQIKSVEKQALRDPSMSSWLSRWGAAMSDADQMLDKILSWQHQATRSSKVLRVFAPYLISSHQRDIQQKCQVIKKSVSGLISEVTDKLIPWGDQEYKSPDLTWISTSLRSTKVFGRENDKRKIIDQIIGSEERPFVISITGEAGVGKTTLAQEIFNDDMVINRFGALRLWVHLPSAVFETYVVVQHTFESITRKEFIHTSDFENIVSNELDGRRYLLVLDHFAIVKLHFWEMTMPMFKDSCPGSVIIITTQDQNIGFNIEKSEQCELQPLSSADSLKLFKEIILEPGEGFLPSALNEIGEKIVERCSGIPFALKYLGLTLQFQREHSYWQGILNDLESGNTAFNLVLNSSSYGELPSYLKQCFLYCGLFPKDHIFCHEYLTDLWLAEDFIPVPSGEVNNHCPTADYTDLLNKSFSRVKDYSPKLLYKMDPLKHSLSIRIPKEFHRMVKLGQPVTIPKECRYLSLISDPTTASFPLELNMVDKLKTIILLREEQMVQLDQKCQISEIPPTLCEDHQDLCVLDLQCSLISELPSAIIGLYNLRYLNLSETEIEMVPEFVGKLVSLQMLILSHCKKLIRIHNSITHLRRLEKLNLEGCHFLAELPKGMSNMKSLRYLNILECSTLKQMPARMGELTNLETLSTYIASTINGCTLSELQKLNNLSGKLCLENLDLVTNEDAKEAKLQEKPELASLTLLWRDKTDSEEIMESLKPNQNLKQLVIIAYPGEQFPHWISDLYLNNLIEIKVVNLKKIRGLPPLGQLPCLEIIEFIGMDSVTSIDEGFFGENGIFLSLKKLTLSYMPNLEMWPSLDERCKFSCLIELHLIHCPKLRALHMVLPSVRRLTMWMNNKLLFDRKGSLFGLSHSLEHVSIVLCGELSKSSQLEGLHGLEHLKELEISGCEELTAVPDGVLSLTSLKCLTISSCSNLVSLPAWLQNCYSLTSFKVTDCPMLRSTPPGLRTLTVHGADVIEDAVSPVRRVVISEPNIIEIQKKSTVDGKGKEKVDVEELNREFEEHDNSNVI